MRKHDYLAAQMSVLHISAFIVGVQTAMMLLGVKDETGSGLMGVLSSSSTTSDAPGWCLGIWLRSDSPAGSTRIFFSEWANCCAIMGVTSGPENSPAVITRELDISKWLRAIENKSAFYLRAPEVTHLRAFIEGVQAVSEVLGSVKVQPDFRAFEGWLRSMDAPNSNCSWDMLLTRICGGDSVYAFRRVFECLREF